MSGLIHKFTTMIPPASTILDAGCGVGRDLEIFSGAGFNTIGLDLCQNMVELARQHSPNSQIIHGDMRNIPLPSDSVDGVWACASLVHLAFQDTIVAIREIARVVRPGGLIFISVKKGEGSARSDDGRLFVFFSQYHVKELLTRAGLNRYTMQENTNTSGQQWISALIRKPPHLSSSYYTPMSIASALAWGRFLLSAICPEDKVLETEELLQHILQIDKAFLYTHPERLLTATEDVSFWSLLNQRLEYYPLAYLLQSRGFMGLQFKVTPEVLIPRPETEILVEYTLQTFQGRSLFGLDIGTGSGCIAIAILKYLPDARMIASDISPGALVVARENAALHQVEGRLSLVEGDLWGPFAQEKFDLVVSNPPYVAEEEYQYLMPEVKCEPAIALLAGDGFHFYRRILQNASDYLEPDGILLLELGHNQLLRILSLVPSDLHIHEVIYDYAGIARVLAIRK